MNLRSALFPSIDRLFHENLTYAMTKNFILEIKFFSGLPKWFKSIVIRYNLPRLSLSKYTICLDSHKNVNRKPRFINVSRLIVQQKEAECERVMNHV